MRLVHKNRTGQPWDKPGHDEGGAWSCFALDVAGIHVLLSFFGDKDVDGRDKPGHDGEV
jgi:hypothetical protein